MALNFQDWMQIEMDILNNENYNKSNLLNELKNHQSFLSKDSKTFFRARTITMENEQEQTFTGKYYGFPASGCGAPPKEKTHQGRCNKSGSSVLYLADDKYTALAEVRPGKRQQVSIAEFKLKKDAKVIDIIYGGHVDDAYSYLAFYFYVVYNGHEKYYKISQHIAQIVKEAGFDGIRYSSSLSESGLNIVLFDTKAAKCLNSKTYQVAGLLYYANEQFPDDSQRLFPKSITDKYSETQINKFLDKFKSKNK